MKRLLFVSLTIVALSFPFVVGAAGQSGFVALQPAQGTMLQNAYQSQSLPQYFNAIFKIALSVGAILAVLQIVRAGYLYMLKDSFAVKQNAKEIFGDAIIGLLILLSVWLILYQINPNILNLNFVQADFSSGSAAQPTTGNTDVSGGGDTTQSAPDTTAQNVITGTVPQQ